MHLDSLLKAVSLSCSGRQSQVISKCWPWQCEAHSSISSSSSPACSASIGCGNPDWCPSSSSAGHPGLVPPALRRSTRWLVAVSLQDVHQALSCGVDVWLLPVDLFHSASESSTGSLTMIFITSTSHCTLHIASKDTLSKASRPCSLCFLQSMLCGTHMCS